MRLLLFLATLVLVVYLSSASPFIGWGRPTRTSWSTSPVQDVKGSPGNTKGGVTSPRPPQLRKGEYMCGGKVCALKPGEVPAGCEHGLCQYPLVPTRRGFNLH